MLVIGASNSSNCNRLRDVAIKKECQHVVDGPEELDMDWLKNVSEWELLQSIYRKTGSVCNWDNNPKKIHNVGKVREKQFFLFPKK